MKLHVHALKARVEALAAERDSLRADLDAMLALFIVPDWPAGGATLNVWTTTPDPPGEVVDALMDAARGQAGELARLRDLVIGAAHAAVGERPFERPTLAPVAWE